MAYNQQLPHVRELLGLAQRVTFPAARDDILQAVSDFRLNPAITGFLRLFSSSQVFESRADFMTRCEELELLISQQRTAPAERLRSPQD